jgi:hypothetical protein
LQIPSLYRTGDCGKLFTLVKDVENYNTRPIGFEGGTIRIHVFSEWPEDMDTLARKGEAAPGSPPFCYACGALLDRQHAGDTLYFHES